jgi:hypothetical protein
MHWRHGIAPRVVRSNVKHNFEGHQSKVAPMNKTHPFKNCKTIIAALVVVSTASLASTMSARAQSPYCGGGWGGCGINFPFGLYGNRVNDVPYFSMFPPVYYSMPIPRTYGWSPFAYPPGTMTPEIEPATPQDLINPYVPQQNDSKKEGKPAQATAARTASYNPPVPQVLINPYVNQTKFAASTSMTKINAN